MNHPPALSPVLHSVKHNGRVPHSGWALWGGRRRRPASVQRLERQAPVDPEQADLEFLRRLREAGL